MGLFSFFFGKPNKVEHHFWGTMLFIEIKNDTFKSYFECSRYFIPSNQLIEIGIDGDKSGPTEYQIDFYQKIEKHYLEISKSIIPMIEDEFRNWKENFRIINFQE
jgi:hypothetical protein